jgi:hypothetical protein
MLCDVHVGHGRRDTFVAQQPLQGRQIRTTFQQVEGKRMAQGMNAARFGNARSLAA